MRDFNLLISTSRGNEGKCASELWFIFRELGVESIDIDRASFSGLLVAKVGANPFEVVSRMRSYVEEKPWDLKYILKVTPIELVVKSELSEIVGAAKILAPKIRADETFRVTVNKRGLDVSTSSVIEAVAGVVDRKVSLDAPSKILLIEIVGNLTGVSVIRKDDVLSVAKIKEEFLKSVR